MNFSVSWPRDARPEQGQATGASDLSDDSATALTALNARNRGRVFQCEAEHNAGQMGHRRNQHWERDHVQIN